MACIRVHTNTHDTHTQTANKQKYTRKRTPHCVRSEVKPSSFLAIINLRPNMYMANKFRLKIKTQNGAQNYRQIKRFFRESLLFYCQ